MRRVLLILFAASLVCTGFAESEDVIPPAQARATTMAFANKLVEAGKTTEAPNAVPDTTLRSPFVLDESPASAISQEGGGKSPSTGPVAVANRGKLDAIAPQVTPSGTVTIGGVPILLFGKKKLKVGDHLPIIFEAQPYELEISDIQQTSFTLRLNGEEVTRPIKSAIKPKS